jgi:hypothetical protein
VHGFRTFSCAHLTRFKLRTSYLPKASYTVQSFDPATFQTWKDTVYSRLTLQIVSYFGCELDAAEWMGSDTTVLLATYFESSTKWFHQSFLNSRVYVCWLHFPRTHETAAGPIHSVAVSKLFPWCIGLERGVLLPWNIFQLSMHRVYSLPVALPSPRTHDERLMMRTLRGCDPLRNGCGQSARKHNDPFSLIAGLIKSYARLII